MKNGTLLKNGILLASLSICSFVSLEALAQRLPQFSGELWTGVFYQDRYDQQWMKFQVNRALLLADMNLDKAWDLSMGFLASSGGSARLEHGYLQHTGLMGSSNIVQIGRIRTPYFGFLEKTISHRWAELRSQAEDRDFMLRRVEGMSFVAPLSDSMDFGFWIHNGAETSFTDVKGPSGQNTDADLAAAIALGVKWSESIRGNTSVHYQARSEPLKTQASLGFANSFGYRSISTAILAEINYLLFIFKKQDNQKDNQSHFGYSLTGQYSFEDTLDSASDVGILVSLRSGNKAYRDRHAEALRFSLGPYLQINKKLRTAFQGFYYQGVSAVAKSDGYQLRWSWEARF
jgi:hypothetical protein